MQKVIAIVGPTATGKSNLGILLAKTLNGEIISADSRQVYKGLNLGSGKVGNKEMSGVPHHMLDVANPKRNYSAGRYQKDAEKIIRYIVLNNKTPIIVGGTGMYVDALLLGKEFPHVPPNTTLRRKLGKKSAKELFALLRKLDPERAQTIEKENPRRLIRAIEIAKALGKVPPLGEERGKYEILWIGLSLPEKKIRKKIHDRLLARLKQGMIAEVRGLHEKDGLAWKRLEAFGLEYRYVALFLQKKITREVLISKLETEIWRYTRRQIRWFKRNQGIRWFLPGDEKKIIPLVKKFLGVRS